MKVKVKLTDKTIWPVGFKAGDIVEVEIQSIVFPDGAGWSLYPYESIEAVEPEYPKDRYQEPQQEIPHKATIGEVSIDTRPNNVSVMEVFGQKIKSLNVQFTE